MPVVTLTSKGQLVIPKEIREYLHLQPGDRLDFIIRDDGDVLLRPAVTNVHDYRAGRADFSDYLIGRLGMQAGCAETLTFDTFLRNSSHFRLL